MRRGQPYEERRVVKPGVERDDWRAQRRVNRHGRQSENTCVNRHGRQRENKHVNWRSPKRGGRQEDTRTELQIATRVLMRVNAPEDMRERQRVVM